MQSIIHLGSIDYLIVAIYFIFVLGIGWKLKGTMTGSGEFLTSARSIPGWVAALAFLSANLGAQEVIGMAASGAKYGIMTSHFYWVGAIPAMVFLGVFMMPFYYGSKARSVPEYLKLRFDEKTRGFNAFSFAVMTIFSSGISMYAMAKLMGILLHWNFEASIAVSATIVLVYIFLGGLTSAIYNEVLQFFMIVFGFAPLVFLGLKNVGGWSGLKEKLVGVSTSHGFAPGAWTQAWSHMGSPAQNPLGVESFGMVMGLGFVLSFGYWCTDFLVVQRALAAKTMTAARRTPLIAAVPKMLLPFLVILPGMIAIALTYQSAHGGAGGFELPMKNGSYDYDLVIPYLLGHYFPTGMLGLGMTALLASFMSGMAGNVTAFNTVWTYDIYQAYIAKDRTDAHYLHVARWTTVIGILLSVGAAYLANAFNNIMDVLQLVFAFVNAPLFATFLLGMFWKRATGHGAFWGLFIGTAAAALHHGLTVPVGAMSLVKGGWLGSVLHTYPSEMAQNFWTAIWAWTSCFVATIFISLATTSRKSDADLRGLVWSLTPHEDKGEVGTPFWKRVAPLGALVMLLTVILNVIFW